MRPLTLLRMKKLDKLILRAFFGPFLLTFTVVEFILLTQYMLKYLDELVGKDLGAEVFGELLFTLASTWRRWPCHWLCCCLRS